MTASNVPATQPSISEFVRGSWLTLTVFVVTAVPSVLQVWFPDVLAALQRTPAVRDGEVWRVFTSLVVQDGGWIGTMSNLLFLLVLGATAEHVLPRGLWFVCCMAGGVIGQVFGLAWQPVGGGNSVAICGLAGALAVWLIAGAGVPRWTPVVEAWWCAALAATISGVALVVGVVAAVGAQVAVMSSRRAAAGDRRRTVGRVVGFAVLAFALLLTALMNIHGPPFTVGAAVTLATFPRAARARSTGSKPT